MAEVTLDAAVVGPGTHALVIGVSHYPYVAGDGATEAGRKFGLEDLSSAARSASEVAAWLLYEYRNPDAPLASLHVLLSPAEGETLADGVAARLPAPYPATHDALERDLTAFRDRCREGRDNVAFVYVAGHGIQLTKRGAIVLLEDFAAPGKLNELHGAIDMFGCHAGMNGDGFAANQFWFVDACRQVPAIARRFERLEGALTLSEPVGQVDSSRLYFASASREVAFAEVGGTTLFSRALLAGLRGAAAEGPDEATGLGWHVPAGRLGDVVKQTVDELAAAKGAVQSVQSTGLINPAVIHRFERPPEVPIVLTLVPPEAGPQTNVSMLFDADDLQREVDRSVEWPLVRTLKAGAYQIRIETQAPYQPVPPKLVNVKPLEFAHEVKVT